MIPDDPLPASFIGPVGRHAEAHETLHRDGSVEWNHALCQQPTTRTLLDSDVAGAQDDHPARGVTCGDIRAWHDENELLRAVVRDMLAGLEYLRITKTIPYGFGIDRLDATGRAALSHPNHTEPT